MWCECSLPLPVVIASVWLINELRSVLLPFLVAWLVAYLLEPFVQYNRRLLGVRNRWLPILMTLFECVLIVVAVSVFIVPSILKEMHQVADFIRHYTENGTQISFVPDSLHRYIKESIDFERISKELTRQDIQSLFDTLGSFIAGGYSFVLGVFNWFIVLLYVVFIML